jgi:hypothetical protein
VSAKITGLTLNGKWKTLTRVRAQRLVDSGSWEWQGERTVREKKPAQQALTVRDRITFDPDFFFNFEYPEQGVAHDLFGLPFNFPLPYDLLRSYRSRQPIPVVPVAV